MATIKKNMNEMEWWVVDTCHFDKVWANFTPRARGILLDSMLKYCVNLRVTIQALSIVSFVLAGFEL